MKVYRKDFPADAEGDDAYVDLETKFLTDERPTTITIFCTQPFRLTYTHPKDQDSHNRFPIDPLPMGVPIVIRDLDWSQFSIVPMLYPARLRIVSQANVHVEPPPGVPK